MSSWFEKRYSYLRLTINSISSSFFRSNLKFRIWNFASALAHLTALSGCVAAISPNVDLCWTHKPHLYVILSKKQQQNLEYLDLTMCVAMSSPLRSLSFPKCLSLPPRPAPSRSLHPSSPPLLRRPSLPFPPPPPLPSPHQSLFWHLSLTRHSLQESISLPVYQLSFSLYHLHRPGVTAPSLGKPQPPYFSQCDPLSPCLYCHQTTATANSTLLRARSLQPTHEEKAVPSFLLAALWSAAIPPTNTTHRCSATSNWVLYSGVAFNEIIKLLVPVTSDCVFAPGRWTPPLVLMQIICQAISLGDRNPFGPWFFFPPSQRTSSSSHFIFSQSFFFAF